MKISCIRALRTLVLRCATSICHRKWRSRYISRAIRGFLDTNPARATHPTLVALSCSTDSHELSVPCGHYHSADLSSNRHMFCNRPTLERWEGTIGGSRYSLKSHAYCPKYRRRKHRLEIKALDASTMHIVPFKEGAPVAATDPGRAPARPRCYQEAFGRTGLGGDGLQRAERDAQFQPIIPRVAKVRATRIGHECLLANNPRAARR